jgi:hypothetical protein
MPAAYINQDNKINILFAFYGHMISIIEYIHGHAAKTQVWFNLKMLSDRFNLSWHFN